MMKKWNAWMKRGVFVAGMAAAVGSAAVEAQNVESVLRARERLELTEQQVQQLDQIRRAAVQERAAEMARMSELRSQLEAGQIRRSELMAAMEDQQDARRARAEERRASLQSILTDEQRASLEEMRRRAPRGRPGVGSRGDARRGPRMGPAQGRGPGFRSGPPGGRAGPGGPPGRGPGPDDSTLGSR